MCHASAEAHLGPSGGECPSQGRADESAPVSRTVLDRCRIRRGPRAPHHRRGAAASGGVAEGGGGELGGGGSGGGHASVTIRQMSTPRLTTYATESRIGAACSSFSARRSRGDMRVGRGERPDWKPDSFATGHDVERGVPANVLLGGPEAALAATQRNAPPGRVRSSLMERASHPRTEGLLPGPFVARPGRSRP